MSTTDRPLTVIGTVPPRKEGREKLTGAALYVDDLPFQNLLYGKTIRSTIPRGKVKSIVYGDGIPWAEFVVVTAKDIPGKNVVTLIEEDQPFLADGVVNHVTEPILLIAHPDKGLLEKAAKAIRIEYDPLPHVLEIDEALEAKTIIRGADNVVKEFKIQDGDPDAVWAKCDVIVEETYVTAGQEQLYIEPQGVVATASEHGGVTVTGSLQCPYYVQKALMPLFKMGPDKVRIIQAETGGAFGGKEEYPNMLSGHAALLSWKAGGRPVKMIYDRMEDLQVTPKRHPSRTKVKAGFSRDGLLEALDIDFAVNAGAYATLSAVVLSRGILHSFGPYRCPNTRIRARAAATNCFPYGAFRGFGAPQSIFAVELHMTRAARILGIDPAELRRKNFYHTGDVMPTGQKIKEEIELERLLDKALTEAKYAERYARYEKENATNPTIRKGIGLSIFFHGSGFTGNGEVMLASKLTLRIVEGGQVQVLASNVEYGQGTNTILSMIAAEALSVPYEWVRVHQPDTGRVPNSGPTVASRTTMIIGRLVQRASEILLARLREQAGLPANPTPEDFRHSVDRFLAKHGSLEATVDYEKPADITWDMETYRGEPYGAYAWSCNIADVEVDSATGEIRLTDFVSVVECGRTIHPLFAAGQIEGGVAQSIGFALYEDVVMKDGAMANTTFTNYIIPTTADTPDIRVSFIEFAGKNSGPFQAKGIGELPADGPGPAIAGAVAQALGGRFINHVPIFPEHVLRRLKKEE